MNEIQSCLNAACQSILRASQLLETDLLISGIEIRRATHELRRANTLLIICDAEERRSAVAADALQSVARVLEQRKQRQ